LRSWKPLQRINVKKHQGQFDLRRCVSGGLLGCYFKTDYSFRTFSTCWL